MKHLFDLLSVYVFPIQNSIYLFIEYTICTANAYSYFGGKPSNKWVPAYGWLYLHNKETNRFLSSGSFLFVRDVMMESKRNKPTGIAKSKVKLSS